MFAYKFVVVDSKGKTKIEVFDSSGSAHAAMGYYAGENDYGMQIHEGRWIETDRSIVYEGDDPMFNAKGYVARALPGDVKE